MPFAFCCVGVRWFLADGRWNANIPSTIFGQQRTVDNVSDGDAVGNIHFLEQIFMDSLSALATAAANRDCDELRDAVNAVNQEYAAAPLLALILLEDWHDSHEDIVFELGLIGIPSVVSAITAAAKTRFRSLVEWGNLPEFQRKCAYALARIGTDESRAALQEMANSPDVDMREYGQEGLHQLPMLYKPR